MATATAQDDDLLIIADDNESSETEQDIEFSFDFGDDTSDTQQETTPIDATSQKQEILAEESDTSLNSLLPEETQAQTEASTPEVVNQESGNDLAMNFDTPATELVEEKKAQEEITSTDESFSFDLESDSAQTDPAAQASDTASMNDILSATIAKLVARQDVIATDKSGKAIQEEEIKAQIKELQAQVKDLESDMATLDKESDKITANIAQLEEMKLDPVKEHNAKRAVKK